MKNCPYCGGKPIIEGDEIRCQDCDIIYGEIVNGIETYD
jgi:DNA-directed RNA polymerase subunit RPC12/RpoP